MAFAIAFDSSCEAREPSTNYDDFDAGRRKSRKGGHVHSSLVGAFVRVSGKMGPKGEFCSGSFNAVKTRLALSALVALHQTNIFHPANRSFMTTVFMTQAVVDMDRPRELLP